MILLLVQCIYIGTRADPNSLNTRQSERKCLKWTHGIALNEAGWFQSHIKHIPCQTRADACVPTQPAEENTNLKIQDVANSEFPKKSNFV